MRAEAAPELAGRPDDRRLDRLARRYLRAVEDESAIEPALALIDTIRAARGPTVDAILDARLTAYRGAITTLRAKHGFWPHRRFANVEEGLELLDRAVRAAPDAAEIRALRLLSGYHLPFFFERGDEVEEDFRRLAALLPCAGNAIMPALYEDIVRFVLENGDLEPAARRPLERLVRDDA